MGAVGLVLVDLEDLVDVDSARRPRAFAVLELQAVLVDPGYASAAIRARANHAGDTAARPHTRIPQLCRQAHGSRALS
jgi:hypothetical protein